MCWNEEPGKPCFEELGLCLRHRPLPYLNSEAGGLVAQTLAHLWNALTHTDARQELCTLSPGAGSDRRQVEGHAPRLYPSSDTIGHSILSSSDQPTLNGLLWTLGG